MKICPISNQLPAISQSVEIKDYTFVDVRTSVAAMEAVDL